MEQKSSHFSHSNAFLIAKKVKNLKEGCVLQDLNLNFSFSEGPRWHTHNQET